MRLEAASRLLATVSKDALRAFVEKLNSEQRIYLFSRLPDDTMKWFGQDLNLKAVKNVNPKLNLASLGASEFHDFLIAWAHLRTISPPTVSGATIYRLVHTDEYPKTTRIKFTNATEYKA